VVENVLEAHGALDDCVEVLLQRKRVQGGKRNGRERRGPCNLGDASRHAASTRTAAALSRGNSRSCADDLRVGALARHLEGRVSLVWTVRGVVGDVHGSKQAGAEASVVKERGRG
jgi:hypothetical protein